MEDITTLTHSVNTSISAAQSHIQACIRAVEQKDKGAFKAYAKALKHEVDSLATLIGGLVL